MAASTDATPGFRGNRPLQVMTAFYTCFWLWAAVAPLHRFDWFLENLLVFASVAGLALAYRRHPFSTFSYLLITIFLTLHTLGSHYTYAEVPLGAWFGETFEQGRNHYDRLVHFAFGLLISYPLREIFLRHTDIRGFPLYFLPFAIVAASSNTYEFIEWGVAMMVDPESALVFLGAQGDAFDAQKDTGLAIIGAVVSLSLTALLSRRASS